MVMLPSVLRRARAERLGGNTVPSRATTVMSDRLGNRVTEARVVCCRVDTCESFHIRRELKLGPLARRLRLRSLVLRYNTPPGQNRKTPDNVAGHSHSGCYAIRAMSSGVSGP